MFADWQNLAVLLIVLAALAYVARRGWARLRGLWGRGDAGSTCATGCGTCGDEKQAAPPTQATVLVQIGRAKSQGRAR